MPRNPVAFSGKSYAQYKIINKKFVEKQQNLSMRLRTLHPNGNLMYAAGRIDYTILEVSLGKKYFLLLCMSESIVFLFFCLFQKGSDIVEQILW